MAILLLFFVGQGTCTNLALCKQVPESLFQSVLALVKLALIKLALVKLALIKLALVHLSIVLGYDLVEFFVNGWAVVQFIIFTTNREN